MAFEKRAPANAPTTGIGNGPYLAKVVSHLDPSFMGSLEVTLQRRQGNTIGDDNQTYVVRCATPFYGSTAYEFMGTNAADFNDTQKSYGMWFVPPDVGVTVMVVFVDGNPADGYWIACIPGRFTNNMVPGIASSTSVELTDAARKKYAPASRLPIAELNRRANAGNENVNIEGIKKAVHPIADRLLEEGLLLDDVRGSHNSSARRDIPSMVFGISTPGPLDRSPFAKRATIGKLQSKTPTPVPVSRLGGTQLVMDDGDDQYQRKTSAGEGPVEYADTLAGQKGRTDIPYGESFRIRTRTGHQILLHNSEDLIYIGNARGTTWVELTSNGKIDVFAKDSVSIHTENDLNIFADRDINLQSGRNFNIKSGGRFHVDAAQNVEIIAGGAGFVNINADLDLLTGGANKFTSGAATDIRGGANVNITAGAESNIRSVANTNITAGADTNIKSVANTNMTSGTNSNIKSFGQHIEQANVIHMNGPDAAEAAAASTASLAIPATRLSTHESPSTNVSAGWNKLYQSGVISSIMKRIPMHEPWLFHENQLPAVVTPANTDRET
jgi:hypothetical protein